ncbi:ABC transporter permease [Acidithiobacillus sulfuriphilus]|uniref:ABC transporter permease n=1 Tax=Acidithiobacillus sulfuriphilus TaxID=1867749 RepID=UPI003F6483C6
MKLASSLAFPMPNRQDLIAIPLVLAVFFLIAHISRGMAVPFHLGESIAISSSPWELPEYALDTVSRMLAAVVCSLAFTLGYATLAAKNRYAEKILIPLLDILQSVPILGYLSITVTGFMALFPGSLIGVQLAVVFAVFTSQVWNMTFALYQGLTTLPKELDEAARLYRLNAWQRFWKLELPFSVPGLLWNTMMSMSGGWFFVVAAEAITVAGQTVAVPGIGSYIALAIRNKDLGAIFWAIATMVVVIFLYDFLLFRPIVAWADKFKFETSGDLQKPQSAVLDFLHRTRLMRLVVLLPRALWEASVRLLPPASGRTRQRPSAGQKAWRDGLFYGVLAILFLAALWQLGLVIPRFFSWAEIGHVFYLGAVTALRVFVLVLLSALIWVPVGIKIGLNPRLTARVQGLAQFLAAFPANLLFPLVVVLILTFHLNVNIWVSPLMILGSQWYILFNVVGAATALPGDLKEAARSFGLRGWLLWKRLLLPGIFPGFVTGAITASGGAWNASIVAEVVSWGSHTLVATGLGAYITLATGSGQMEKVALGIGVMSLYVITVNRFFWRRLYRAAERRFRLD